MKDLMRSKKMWIAFGVIFLSGIAIGVVGGIYYNSYYFNPAKKEDQRHQDRIKMHMLRLMSAELKLTDDQKVQVEKILGEMTKSINDIHASQMPEIKTIIDKSFAEIDKILTDEQKIKLVDMQKRMAESRKKYRQDRDRRKRGGREGGRKRDGGPPPPQWQREGKKKRLHPEGERKNFDADAHKRREAWKKRKTKANEKLPPPPGPESNELPPPPPEL